jgi:putative peptide zinc metalloprotease protein
MTGARTGVGTALLELRPARRTDLRISPPTLRGTARVRLIKDPVSGRRYEVRAKEYFVLERLDGRRTLAEIGEQYAGRFGARLGEPQWRQLLRLLYGRGLMADAPTPPPAREASPSVASASASASRQQPSAKHSTLLNGTVRLVSDAPAFIERVYRLTGPMRRPAVLAVLTAVLAAMLGDLAANAGELGRDTTALIRQPALLLAVLTLLWASQALHEIGHGVAGRSFGAQVDEIGLRWHWGTVLMYCRVEDVPFLPRRREQVATAAAGVLVNLSVLAPFWAAWLLSPASGPAGRDLGGLLLIGALAALVNLLPLPPLDGYLVLCYALGVSRLATESSTFAKLAVSSLIGRRRDAVAGYSPRLRVLYSSYTLLALALAVGTSGAAILVARKMLIDRFGSAAGLVPVALVGAAIALWAIGLAAAGSRRRARPGPPGSAG